MYRDKDRQREAVRLAVQRHRARKGITKVLPEKTVEDVIPVIPKPVPSWRVEKDRQMAEFLKKHG